MKIVLVGGGGLGSILAENIGRLGFGEIIAVDDDIVSEHSLNRWQGGMPADVGRPKVEALGERLKHMFPTMKVTVLSASVYELSVESKLAEGDIIIGAVDNDHVRYFLNRFAIQYGVPYMDSGVSVIAEKGRPVDFQSRFFFVVPGQTACLCCTKFILYDKTQTMNAFLDEATLAARRNAGYVVDIPEINAPSVYQLNQKAAAMLMTELANYICGWRPLATAILEKWREAKIQRADRSNYPEAPGSECPVCGFYAGAGNTEPLPRPAKYRDVSIAIPEKGGSDHGE